jgi:perosamine synthetase
MKIPWAIPNTKPEDVEYVKEILDSGWYTMGKVVRLLEEKMAGYVGAKHGIAVNNGTIALEVVLRSLNIGENDEVIVPAFSYIASATSVNLAGAKPVFIDVDKSMTINPDLIDDKVTKKTKAVMAVDLTGSPCNYDLLNKKCEELGLTLIVDGAQSLGSIFNDKSCISYGLMGTTSFHAAKIITTVEGGMIFTDDDNLSNIARAVRTHGEGEEKYVHKFLGGNYRMTDISAGFGIKQIDRYDKTLKERAEKVELYKKLLRNIIEFLEVRNNSVSCNFIFPIFYEKREELASFLKAKGVDTRKIYPMTIPQQPIYNIKESYPVSEWFCDRTLSLPLYADLASEQIKYVCENIREFVENE